MTDAEHDKSHADLGMAILSTQSAMADMMIMIGELQKEITALKSTRTTAEMVMIHTRN